MDIKKIMTTDVECIRPDATLKDAAIKMEDLGVGILPVCDEQQVFGILTDRDIVIRAVAQGANPQETEVRDIMTPHVEYCFDDDDLREIVKKMKTRQIRRMVVVDHNRKLAGIVTLGDISVRGDHKLAEETLERISEPSRPWKRPA